MKLMIMMVMVGLILAGPDQYSKYSSTGRESRINVSLPSSTDSQVTQESGESGHRIIRKPSFMKWTESNFIPDSDDNFLDPRNHSQHSEDGKKSPKASNNPQHHQPEEISNSHSKGNKDDNKPKKEVPLLQKFMRCVGKICNDS
jgi:hypothetical protein